MVSMNRSIADNLPANTVRTLEEFVARAQSAFGDDLKSIVLFGSAAEGSLRATSDVNIVVVLTQFAASSAEALRAPFRVTQAAIRLRAMFILEAELPGAVNAFAEKFADILRRRKVLLGVDPFAGVTIARVVIIARLDQVLLNLILRLRDAYVVRGMREEQLALTIADAAGPLRSSAATLLGLQGTPAQSPKAALESFVQSMDNADASAALAQISLAREQRLLPPGVAETCLLNLIDIAAALRDRFKAMEG